MNEVLGDIIAVLKKAPELTQSLLEQQLLYHKKSILASLDAVPMHVFEQQMGLLRQVMLKLQALEEKMDDLESR